jgi:hypothetical protein
MSKKPKQYIFTLKGFNINTVEEKYKITTCEIPTNTTKLIDLVSTHDTTTMISFLDETKHARECTVVMVDINTQDDIFSTKTDCFWCSHPFDGLVIGCPINYVAHKATKTYYSEISKDVYTIKENITDKRLESLKTCNIDKLHLKTNGYYECDGGFCSFNCCQAFIEANKHDSLYESSESLLIQVYNKLFSAQITEIKPAPHWRMLKKYKGKLDIETFRANFNKIDCIYHGILRNIFKPIGHVYEEKLKF